MLAVHIVQAPTALFARSHILLPHAPSLLSPASKPVAYHCLSTTFSLCAPSCSPSALPCSFCNDVSHYRIYQYPWTFQTSFNQIGRPQMSEIVKTARKGCEVWTCFLEVIMGSRTTLYRLCSSISCLRHFIGAGVYYTRVGPPN